MLAVFAHTCGEWKNSPVTLLCILYIVLKGVSSFNNDNNSQQHVYALLIVLFALGWSPTEISKDFGYQFIASI